MDKDLILNAIKSAGYKAAEGEVDIEHPQNPQFGDYATTVALSIAKKEGKNPKEIAEKIVEHIPVGKESEMIESVNVVGGFINFTLKKEWLSAQINKIVKDTDDYGFSDLYKGKKIMVEYGVANTHKYPHIGHLFGYIYGESVARLIKASGAETIRNNYQGDVGPHVAKCVWAYLQKNPKDPGGVLDRAELLQQLYQYGATQYKDDPKAKEEIDQINKKIYEKNVSVKGIWEMTRKWSLEYYDRLEKRLGIEYKKHYFESELFEKGAEIVKKNVGKVFKESEEAIVFDGEKYGLHTRVFLTAKETAPYEAKDLGLQNAKYDDWKFDKSIIITASPQNEYFKVVLKALELTDPKFENKIEHIGTGLIQLKGGKMSSRTGNIVTAEDLLNQAVEAISGIVEKREGVTKEEKEAIAEKVGVGAVKWAFLKSNPKQDSVYDFKESISFEGNSGPYMQYTYARANSVVREAGIRDFSKHSLGEYNEPEETALLRTLYKYPEVVFRAAKDRAPNDLCIFLYDLAQKFSGFYNKHRVLQAESEEIKNSRLLLTAATAQIIKNGLNLLGVDVLEKM